jgi:GDPmannose 4,6-dehydratase
VRDFVIAAFACAGIDDWQRYIEADSSLFRPAEVDLLIGDASKAYTQLGWQPMIAFEDLVKMMVESDLQALERERSLRARSVVASYGI